MDKLLTETVLELQSRMGAVEAKLEHLHECAHDQRDKLGELQETLNEVRTVVASKRRPIMLGAGSGTAAAAIVQLLASLFGPRP